MNTLEKLLRSWWVLISFISFINGFGFIYMGFITQNRVWVLEGLTYEIPWLFLVVYQQPDIFGALSAVALLVQLIGIVRSIWVDMKYLNMLERHI